MENSAPYNAPDSQLLDQRNQQTEPVRIFSTTQRLGRARYVAYNFTFGFVFFMIAAVIFSLTMSATQMTGTASSLSPILIILLIVAYLVPIIINFIVGRRRLHDLDRSGWLMLLILVPLVNLFFALYLIFAPGTKGENQYGPKPEPNSVLVWIGAIAPIVVIGLLAAIAIPAYHDYVEKAKAASYSN